uniref:Long-chain-fatty-acid--CoA ligase n=1 Tax=Lygus hesperus TaxID=30085 RepID=A0A0A9YY22_LYGHE
MSVLYQQGMLIASLKYYSFRHYTTADIFDIYATKYRTRPFLQLENEIWTYDDVKKVSNQIARWYRSLHVGRNQTVALILENCPEYFVFWIAAHRLGICCALINYHQTKIPLLHSLHISKAHVIITDEKNYAKIMSCYDNDPPIPVYILRESLHPKSQQLYRERNPGAAAAAIAGAHSAGCKGVCRVADQTITTDARDSESSIDDVHQTQIRAALPAGGADGGSAAPIPSSDTIVKTINDELFL